MPFPKMSSMSLWLEGEDVMGVADVAEIELMTSNTEKCAVGEM